MAKVFDGWSRSIWLQAIATAKFGAVVFATDVRMGPLITCSFIVLVLIHFYIDTFYNRRWLCKRIHLII